ncbi:type IV secretion system protein [Bartonella sp. TT121SHDZB]|uniref:type IV secretion system protein n=1 Tax=Bartonella sp. TT121SHDZB TaxID=3243580 RepID=UPI0035D0C922
MKKQVISIAIAVTLGTQNLAMAWSFGLGTATLAEEIANSWSWETSSSTPESKKTPKQKKVQPITPVLDILKKQFEKTKRIHESITGVQKFNTKKLKTEQTDNTSFFLKDPETLYNKNTYLTSTISASLANILKEEEILTSFRESRDAIAKRIEYASLVDKAVSLQTFQETKNRFTQIEKLLNEIEKTKDLKGIAELQSHIIGTLAMIQNETTKLYMVAHLRNSEQSLIKQQKDKHNARILNSKNTKMPTIRFIR